MSKRAWMLVALALGGGILLQIPTWGGHAEHHAGDGHDHAAMTGMASGQMESRATSATAVDDANQRTVALDVTGMT